MPTMNATNTPHAVAIKMSDVGRRVADVARRTTPDVAHSASSVGRLVMSAILSSAICLQRPLQQAGAALDDGNHVEQKHKRSERERDGDRAGAPAALLLVGEHDALLAVFSVHASASQ